VNPEFPPDWLEDALKRRPAMAAPPDFAERVWRRLEPRRTYSPFFRVWMDNGLVAGLTLAILGIGSTIDLNRLGVFIAQGLQAPPPFLVAAAAFCGMVVWLSVTADDAP
jgi:hypothetical protein